MAVINDLTKGQLSDSGTPTTLGTVPGGKSWNNITIDLHNTNTTDEVVQLFINGTAVSDRWGKFTLAADQTLTVVITQKIGAAGTIKGYSTTANKVNYFITPQEI